MIKKILEFCKSLVYPFLLIALLVLGYFALNAVEREPLVIFAGGGSVKNFIENVKGVKIGKETFTNSVYINLPSGYVPTLLKEEIERFKNEEYDNHSFLYICLSAEKIDSIENNNENARVFEDSIGVDPLVVYKAKNNDSIPNNIIHEIVKKISKNTPISITELNTLIKSNILNVYATSRKSGTYHAYQKAFNSIGERNDSIIKDAELFFEEDSISDCSIVLSSNNYPPKKYNSYSSSKIYTIDTKSKNSDSVFFYKPLYVYFVAYKQNGKFVPNAQILEFLNMIHNCAVSKKKWEEWVQKQNSTKREPINIDVLWK